MMNRIESVTGCVFLFLGLLVGCADGADDTPGGGPCAVLELTQQCSASCGMGRQVCMVDGWSDCDCGLDGASGGAGAGTVPLVVTAGSLRTDITFDWDEATPGQAGLPGGVNCKPGTYEGTYMLEFTPVLAPDFVTPTMGPFVVVFGTERKGEFLATSEGSTLEVAFLPPTIEATMELDGGINCATGKFIATSVDCEFTTNGIPAGPCTCDLEGDFDPTDNSITGKIVSDVPNQGMGDGTFMILLTP